jgi:hypothetical protein
MCLAQFSHEIPQAHRGELRDTDHRRQAARCEPRSLSEAVNFKNRLPAPLIQICQGRSTGSDEEVLIQ